MGALGKYANDRTVCGKIKGSEIQQERNSLMLWWNVVTGDDDKLESVPMGTSAVPTDHLTCGWMLASQRIDPKRWQDGFSPVVSSAFRNPLGDERERIKKDKRWKLSCGKKNVFNYTEEDCGSTCSFLLRTSFVSSCLQRSWQDTDPGSVWPPGKVCAGSRSPSV